MSPASLRSRQSKVACPRASSEQAAIVKSSSRCMFAAECVLSLHSLPVVLPSLTKNLRPVWRQRGLGMSEEFEAACERKAKPVVVEEQDCGESACERKAPAGAKDDGKAQKGFGSF